MERKEKAEELFKKGFSCSEAIVLAFKDLLNIDEKNIKKIAMPFGGGMGRLRSTCGAFSGILIVFGILFGNDDIDPIKKSKLYADIHMMGKEFEKTNGSLLCSTLLNSKENNNPFPSPRTTEYYSKRPCVQIVRNAAEILDNFIKSH